MTGSRVRSTRNGPKARASYGSAGSGSRCSISSRARDVVPLARVEHPDPAPQRHARSITRSARRSSARGTMVVGKLPRSDLPGAEVERLVAEEHVVGAARAGEPCLCLGPSRLARVGLPLEEGWGPVPGPRHLRGHERRHQRDGDAAERRAIRAIVVATAIASSGARKIRCRDSGAADPPSFATRNAATVVPTRHRTRVRAVPRRSTTPTAAAMRTTSVTGHQPAVASPTERHRYRATACGPPSFSPPPPTPTSNRPRGRGR